MVKNSMNLTYAELKTLVDALNAMPSYLSKRFVLKNLLNWSDEIIEENQKMIQEELDAAKIGDKARSWR